MKSKLISSLLPLILGFMLVFGSPLKAELFSVSAGIPLSHDIKDENQRLEHKNRYYDV